MTTRDTPEAALIAVFDREIARWQRAEVGTQQVTLAQYLAARIADAVPVDAARLREMLATRGTIVEAILREALSGIVDADHAGSEDGTGKWRCRCPAHVAALNALEGASEMHAALAPAPSEKSYQTQFVNDPRKP